MSTEEFKRKLILLRFNLRGVAEKGMEMARVWEPELREPARA